MIENSITLNIISRPFNNIVNEPDQINIVSPQFISQTLNSTSLIEVYKDNLLLARVRYDWSKYLFDLETLIIPETELLCFGGGSSWGIIDLKNLKVLRTEEVCLFYAFNRMKNTVIALEELSAESLDLNGNKLEKISLDPPFTSEYFEDRVEYECSFYGKQTLTIR